ncbi:MAG: lytic transglycosylase domain-containing protein [Pseudomarimonas sp.]
MVTRLLALFTLLLAAQASVAATSVLYRCKGKQGEIAYVSSRAGYAQCTAVRTYIDTSAAAPKAATPAVSAGKSSPQTTASTPATSSIPAGKRVEFRTAAGDAKPESVADPSGKAKVTRGSVYRFVKNGVTHYTNRRPAGGAQVVFSYTETCFACSARPGYDFSSVALNTTAYADEIRNAAQTAGVDEALIRAIIHAESAFNPNALSNKGAQGLMQLIPATADRFNVSEPFTPAENIRGGATYLAWLLKRFDGDTRLASAGYNAGEGAVDRYSGVPPYNETQLYVERVAILHQRYKGALASTSAPPVASSGSGTSGQP